MRNNPEDTKQAYAIAKRIPIFRNQTSAKRRGYVERTVREWHRQEFERLLRKYLEAEKEKVSNDHART